MSQEADYVSLQVPHCSMSPEEAILVYICNPDSHTTPSYKDHAMVYAQTQP